jgi:hypothetical protein
LKLIINFQQKLFKFLSFFAVICLGVVLLNLTLFAFNLSSQIIDTGVAGSVGYFGCHLSKFSPFDAN